MSIEDVTTAVEQELQGPGELLGYRPMELKIRQVHSLNVPRQLVYDVMCHFDPECLENWGPCLKKVKERENVITWTKHCLLFRWT